MSVEVTPAKSVETRSEGEKPWAVIVLNDPVNLMSYVVMVFKKVFGYDNERATRHMLEVHHEGRSKVWSGGREQAEAYVHVLQGWQLQARLEQSPA
jgi:ATP-dependent Clp protease adaptor protein ClpS